MGCLQRLQTVLEGLVASFVTYMCYFQQGATLYSVYSIIIFYKTDHSFSKLFVVSQSLQLLK